MRSVISRRSALCLIGPALHIIAGADALAVDRAWLNPVSGNWITGGNWTPTGFPTSGDTATIAVASASPYTVTLSNGVTIGALTLNHPQATLQVNPGGGLNMGAGTINVSAGTFSMGNAQINGTGTLTVSPGALLALSGCTMPTGFTYALSGAVRITGTVQGFTSGGITNNGAMTLTGASTAWLFTQQPLTNNGTITADGVGGGAAQLSVRLNNTATGTVNLQTSTNTFGSPQTNSGALTLAAGKTLTIGSFATVNQNAGAMTINGAYTHQNGAFNMNGGALSIPAGGSFLKDGGNFNYSGGTITGEPVVRSGALTFGAGASSPASFRVRGPNGAIGNIPANVTLTVEATATEAASTGRIGAFSNSGTIRLIGGTTNAASLYAQGGTLTNTGTILLQSPPAVAGDGGVSFLAFVFAEVYNINIVRANPTEGSIDAVIDAQNANHRNTGQIETGPPTQPGGEPSTITIKEGSNATFRQEGGSITNGGGFTVGAGCTFEFTGGACTGNPIVIDGGTLSIGPSAGAGSFWMHGANNTISANAIAANQSVTCGPDVAGGEAGECVWDSPGIGTPPSVEGGSVLMKPYLGFDSLLDLIDGLDIGAGGELRVENSGGTGKGVILGVSTDLIDIDGTPGDPAALNCFGPLDIQLGVSVGAGSVAGTIWWSGDSAASGAAALRGAAGSALIHIGGTYAQGAAGSLRLGIAGPAAGAQHDQVAIAGAATLGGELAIALGNGFQPVWGNVFTVMTFASRSGDFAAFSAAAPANPSLRWWREAGTTDYRVGVRHIADVNRDGVVNFADLNRVLSFYGQAATPGSPAEGADADGDGVVGFTDLNAVLSFYGLSA